MEVIEDPLRTTTLADLLGEMRDLVDYALASRAELLKDFPSDNDTYAGFVEALGLLRLTVASISLDKLLEENRRKCSNGYSARAFAARPASDGCPRIDIREGEDCSTDEVLRHQYGP
jgi:hypothetical protein